MSEYKKKHANDLSLGRKIRQLAVILPFAVTLTTGCEEQLSSQSSEQKCDLFDADSIRDRDYFGHPVTLKHVRLSTHDNLRKDEQNTFLLRWGTPKEELPDIYNGELVYTKAVYISNDMDRTHIRVFKSRYGVIVSKEQPCFIVTPKNKLVYIGDQSTYLKNIQRYALINNLLPVAQAEKKKQYVRTAKNIKMIDEQSVDTLFIPTDSIVNDRDSLAADIKTDSTGMVKNTNILAADTIIKDSLSQNQEIR